ncbi:MAG TPA: hypothetical protein PKY82_22995 [Pyrinomonadaceae bacterium]|nr:hypothetical protein [Pyrinomonadaceae bacterium]
MIVMTETKKIREINIEVERVRVISNLKKTKIKCLDCGKISEFIAIPIALQIFEITEMEIAKFVNEQLIHLKKGINNEIIVCLPSILSAKNYI